MIFLLGRVPGSTAFPPCSPSRSVLEAVGTSWSGYGFMWLSVPIPFGLVWLTVNYRLRIVKRFVSMVWNLPGKSTGHYEPISQNHPEIPSPIRPDFRDLELGRPVKPFTTERLFGD